MYQVKRPKQMDESVVDQLEMLGFDRAFAKSSVRVGSDGNVHGLNQLE